jgi:hypothetical protein
MGRVKEPEMPKNEKPEQNSIEETPRVIDLETGEVLPEQPATQAQPPAQPNALAVSEPESLERVANAPERAISAFSSEENFVGAQRMAKAIATSSLMPREYQGNIPNVLIAMELASRIGVSVLMVAQNLDLIHNRPSWRATFLIATVNQCGRFTPLRFRWQGKEGEDSWGARAVAKDRSDGQECLGTLITIGLAKKEGWYQKAGSKWQTIPEQMICYRAAAFWTRLYAPELSLGMHTSDEVIDTYGEEVREMPNALRPGDVGGLEAALRNKANGQAVAT